MQPTGSDSTLKQRKDCVTGKAKRLDTPTQNVITRNTGVIVKHHDHDWWRHHCDAIVFVGGGFWGWYDGWWYPAWGYDPVLFLLRLQWSRSMATTDFDPTRSLPTFRQRCSNWDIMPTQLTECWGRQLKQPSRITSAITGFQLQERSIHQQ